MYKNLAISRGIFFLMIEQLIKNSVLSNELTRPFGWNSVPRDNTKIWLDKNENVDPEYQEFIRQVAQEIPNISKSTYPEPAILYKKLSDLDNVPIDSLFLTAGSDGAIRYSFELFINPKDKILITSPSFAMYDIYCRIFGAQTYKVYYQRSPKGPIIEFANILKALLQIKPKMFCLPNPDSPTGSILTYEQIMEIINLCNKENIILLIDEAYYPFYPHSFSNKVGSFKNLIIARTFSKAWGLAGLRTGYVIGHPETIKYFHKIKPMYELGTYSIAFIEKMINYSEKMEASTQNIIDGKTHFLKEMEKIGFDTFKSEGNFLHVAFGEGSEKIHKELSDIVLYRKNFKEDCLSGYSRFTATTKENFKPIINKIKSTQVK